MFKPVLALILSVGALMATPVSAAERDHRLPGAHAAGTVWRPDLLVREQPPASGDRSRPVLYVHGATFPSALSVMFKFDGSSWADTLNAAGFDVFGLDFAGYGGSERYPGMEAGAPNIGEPLGRAPDAAEQIERAVRFIQKQTGASKVSIIAHSWGTVPAGRFAGAHPDLVDRLVLFGPIARRDGPSDTDTPTPWTYVTIAEQHARFVKTVPRDSPPVLEERDFPRWAQTYLASDPTSATRNPPSVKIPSGPSADVDAAWSGRFPYDPSLIRAPTLIVRGEWDSTSPDADVGWLKTALTGASEVADIKVPRATHLMHLEEGRKTLYAATNAFLAGTAPSHARTGLPPADRRSLFAVVFEVRPDPAHQSDYLRIAGELRPELLKMPGFLENERFASRDRPGVLLSLSLWDDEKSLIRWRTVEKHHEGQVAGRDGVLADYHLRVGEVTVVGGRFADRRVGWVRQDETEVGDAKALTIFDGEAADLDEGSEAVRPIHREVFDHLTARGRVAVLSSWKSLGEAEAYATRIRARSPSRAEVYAIRVIRDYGQADRREAPQFYPPRRRRGPALLVGGR